MTNVQDIAWGKNIKVKPKGGFKRFGRNVLRKLGEPNLWDKPREKIKKVTGHKVVKKYSKPVGTYIKGMKEEQESKGDFYNSSGRKPKEVKLKHRKGKGRWVYEYPRRIRRSRRYYLPPRTRIKHKKRHTRTPGYNQFNPFKLSF